MTFSDNVDAAAVALASLCFIWFIGYRVADRWERRQLRRRIELASIEAFYALYGEFIAVWKLWDGALRFPGCVPSMAEHRREMLLRATIAEGSLEALLVKVVSERRLTPGQRNDLARFRHGFRCLRLAIREDRNLGWFGPEDLDYVRFKSLALSVAAMLSPSSRVSRPEAFNALTQVTETGAARDWRAPASRPAPSAMLKT